MNEPYYIKKVREFRELVGLKNDAETAKAITKEEMYELFTASKPEDIADGIGDVIVTASGQYIDGHIDIEHWGLILQKCQMFSGYHKIDTNIAFNIVHASNMSKICGAEHVQASLDKYADINVKARAVEVAEGRFAIYCVEGYGDFVPGKLLKPVTYFEPDWFGDRSWKIERVVAP